MQLLQLQLQKLSTTTTGDCTITCGHTFQVHRPRDSETHLNFYNLCSLPLRPQLYFSLKSFDTLRRFERFLLEAAGTYPVLDFDCNGKHLDDQTCYRLHQFQELVEVNSDEADALQGADWIALSKGLYTQPATAKHAKWLHRSLVDHTLGGRRLVSREMLSEVGKSR